ncbi:Crp/Fnr family transcriptional regulator [Marinilabiliaceae bacterium ANBcel2]|nr:Crp/Fnr family transcriptional regulator [Marinilabiliaceae bacterium ANBcel2]
MEKSSNIVNYNKGDIIIKEGTPSSSIIKIESGLIKISSSHVKGKSTILQLAKAGEYIGCENLILNEKHKYSATAITKTKVSFILTDQITWSVNSNNNEYKDIISQSIKNSQLIIDRLISVSNKQLPGRVADIILYFYNTNNNIIEFEFPLNRSELADFAGTTKESFIRTLTEFKNDKIIELKGRRLKINSLKIIETLSRLG